MAGIMNKKIVTGLLIGLGLVIVLLFGFRLMRALRHWGMPPRPQPQATLSDVELIRDWMPIPYIARTYGVPDRMLFDALQIPEKENRKKNLEQLNSEFFPNQPGFVIAQVQQAIRAFQDRAPQTGIPQSPPTAPAAPTP